MKGDENVMNLITKISNLHESAKKIKDKNSRKPLKILALSHSKIFAIYI